MTFLILTMISIVKLHVSIYAKPESIFFCHMLSLVSLSWRAMTSLSLMLSSFKMSRMTLQLLRSMARMISAWRGRTEAKYPGSGVPTLPVGGSARRFICRISHVWCLVVLAHLLCTFSVGHFHICAREGIYETVTDSSTLPPTWSAKFLARLGKWTWKGNLQKRARTWCQKKRSNITKNLTLQLQRTIKTVKCLNENTHSHPNDKW